MLRLEYRRDLLAVQKLAADNSTAFVPETEVVKRWWAQMANLMECNPDNSPVVEPLKKVFHLE